MKKLFVFLMLGLFMISFASAWDFDNVGEYDEDTRTMKVKNCDLWLGICLNEGEELANITLTDGVKYEETEDGLKTYLPVGDEVLFAEIYIDSKEEYKDAIKGMRYYDKKNNMKEIQRKIVYKKKIINMEVKEDCIGNSTTEEDCLEEIISWGDVSQNDFKEGGQTLGLFTELKRGDKIEWIPEYLGIKVKEWAVIETKEVMTADSGWTNQATTANYGVRIAVGGDDILVYSVTKAAAVTATTAEICKTSTSTSCDGAAYATATFVGNVATFASPFGLNASSGYSVHIGKGGASYNSVYKSPSPAYTVSGTYLDFTARAGGATTEMRNFISMNVSLAPTNTAPNITLNSPSSTNYTTPQSLSINFTAWDDFDLDNVSIYVNDVLNQTNSTGVNNSDYIFPLDLADGDYTIYGRATDNESLETNSSSIRIFIDSIKPTFVTGLNTSTIYAYGNTILLNTTVTDINLDTVWYNYNGTNTTITGALNATLNQTAITTVAGQTTITIYANDTSGNENSTTETFVFDSIAPAVNITKPIGEQTYIAPGSNETLNWTATDVNLDTCWYSYNGTNTTVTCGDNTTGFVYATGVNDITFYANDTLGNINSSSSSWSYLIENFAVTYDANKTEGEQDVFTANITLASGETITQAIFEFNDTNYTTSISFSGGKYVIGSSITAPLVAADTNVSFRFYIVVDGVTYSPFSNNQTILNLNFGECGVVSSDVLMTMFLLDEVTRTSHNGSIQINADLISKTSGETVATLNNSFVGITNASICFDPVASYPLYYMDVEMRYEANDYAAEFYFMQKADLANFPTNLSLFDLELNSSTEFLVKYQDDNLITVEGAIVQLLRSYIGADTNEVVEAPLTSNIGTAVVHVDLNTNLYKAIIVKDGVVLDTFTNIVFDCENELSGQCSHNLFGKVDPQNSVETITLRDFSVDVSEVNNTITTLYSIPSGTPSTVNIHLTQVDSFGSTLLCNQTIVSSAGSIDCDYNTTIGDSRVYLTVLKDGEPEVNKGYYIEEDLDLGFAGNNYLIALLLLLTLVGMAFTSPEWTVIIAIVAFVIAGGLWLINGMNLVMGLGLIVFVIAAAVIIIKDMSGQEDN